MEDSLSARLSYMSTLSFFDMVIFGQGFTMFILQKARQAGDEIQQLSTGQVYLITKELPSE